jgi:hypothetical protein
MNLVHSASLVRAKGTVGLQNFSTFSAFGTHLLLPMKLPYYHLVGSVIREYGDVATDF